MHKAQAAAAIKPTPDGLIDHTDLGPDERAARLDYVRHLLRVFWTVAYSDECPGSPWIGHSWAETHCGAIQDMLSDVLGRDVCARVIEDWDGPGLITHDELAEFELSALDGWCDARASARAEGLDPYIGRIDRLGRPLRGFSASFMPSTPPPSADPGVDVVIVYTRPAAPGTAVEELLH